MAISMVREPSETPNINNVDDFVGLRYAYGDQNGYVKGFGNECSNTINGNIFHINSGRLVLQGVECDIDANGVDITIDPVSATRYYVIYLQVNLSTNQVSISSTHSPSAYPTISAGDDLTENNSGTARLELYRFVATSGTISNVSKTVTEIVYMNKATKVNQSVNSDTVTNGVYTTDFNNAVQTKFGDYIVSKKKLLWSGDLAVSYNGTGMSNFVPIYTDSSNVSKRIFEIEYHPVFSGADYGGKFVKFKAENASCYDLVRAFTDGMTVIANFSSGYSEILPTQLGVKIMVIHGSLDTARNIYIKKVYEIFE